MKTVTLTDFRRKASGFITEVFLSKEDYRATRKQLPDDVVDATILQITFQRDTHPVLRCIRLCSHWCLE